jgi:hypothetical protein
MHDFAALEAQDVRDHWKHEAQEFTPWLADQIEAENASDLEDVLGLDLEVIEREKSVGKYNVDIFARVVEDGRNVVVENQLEDSDHNHLGKSIAYAAGLDADIIVWIASKFNDEHTDAIQWLNKNSREGVDLFAIRLEVWRIGDSKPAVRFNAVEEPSEWQEKAKRTEGELTETKTLQEEFWTTFRDRIESSETPLRPRKPKPQHWYDNPIGKSGFKLQFTANTVEDKIYCQLIIRDDAEAYQQLDAEREQIEEQFGEQLVWSAPEDAQGESKRSKISISRTCNLSKREDWEDYIDWMVDRGERFHDVFYDRIQQF